MMAIHVTVNTWVRCKDSSSSCNVLVLLQLICRNGLNTWTVCRVYLASGCMVYWCGCNYKCMRPADGHGNLYCVCRLHLAIWWVCEHGMNPVYRLHLAIWWWVCQRGMNPMCRLHLAIWWVCQHGMNPMCKLHLTRQWVTCMVCI